MNTPNLRLEAPLRARRPTCRAAWHWLWAAGLSVLGAHAETILSSKHDLSVVGPGPIKAVSESEVCVFCHTPHRGTGEQPLWNHALSAAIYTPYGSSTTKVRIGQPTGASKLCLSCHDGTVALGMVNTRATPIEIQGGRTMPPANRSNLGTDLSDDHPISFTYDGALVAANGQLKDPGGLMGKVRLDANRQVQCTACHDAHNNQYGKFLVQDNYASALCLNCHNVRYWENSVHRNSGKTWNGVGLNPWPHTRRLTVSANACESCHTSHAAGIGPRLLTFPEKTDNCYSCHNGNVAALNIQAEFDKSSVHPVLRNSGLHDPQEDLVNPPRHVECADCHNPHAATTAPAAVPDASGALAGVAGISSAGTAVVPLLREYELCYRCHADSIARGPARVSRQAVQTNVRLEFQAANASFHPIEATGRNPNVPSLIAPLTTASRMYCTDCHNNNQGPGAGGTGPRGPHGSAYTPLLERDLTLADYATENYGIYELCYKCHDRNSILGDQSFPSHKEHIVDQRTACTTCHDPHGVQATTHLINFNVVYVTPSSNGRREFVDNGTRRGNCSLACHGTDHRALSYGQ